MVLGRGLSPALMADVDGPVGNKGVNRRRDRADVVLPGRKRSSRIRNTSPQFPENQLEEVAEIIRSRVSSSQ